MAAEKRAKTGVDSDLASIILRTVPTYEVFLFFTDIRQYEGEFACMHHTSAETALVPLNGYSSDKGWLRKR